MDSRNNDDYAKLCCFLANLAKMIMHLKYPYKWLNEFSLVKQYVECNSVVPVCFIFDFFPDGGEVHELLALGVQKLAILVLAVDQLED